MHSREQLEERMGIVLSQMVERQRQIRAARQAEEELQRLRAELLDLAHQYAKDTETDGPARVSGPDFYSGRLGFIRRDYPIA